MSPLALLIVLLAPPVEPAPGAADPSAASAPPTQAPTAPPKPATGPPPEVEMKCAPEPVRVGEPLVCTLTAVHPDSVSITVPLPAGAAEIEIVSGADAAAAATEKRPDGKLQTTRRFQIVPKEPKASLKVPAVQVVFTEATGGEGKLEVPGRKVPLKRLLENAQDPQFRTFKTPGAGGPAAASAPPSGAPDPAAAAFIAAHGPVPFVTTNWPALITAVVLGGGLVGGLMAWGIMRLLARRRRVEIPWVDPRPAHEIALAALDALQSEQLPAQGKMKEFYFRLSEIVRAYLEKRYGFGALEMTSDEIRSAFRSIERDRVTAELSRRGLSPTEMQMLLPERLARSAAVVAVEDFLVETDFVKFADLATSESSADTAMRAARGIVELTREPDAPPPGSPTPATAATAGGPT